MQINIKHEYMTLKAFKVKDIDKVMELQIFLGRKFKLKKNSKM